MSDINIRLGIFAYFAFVLRLKKSCYQICHVHRLQAHAINTIDCLKLGNMTASPEVKPKYCAGDVKLRCLLLGFQHQLKINYYMGRKDQK